jgi:ATP-binding protein involved in chromosome partitioning
VRQAVDAGTPIAATDAPEAEAYARLAQRLVAGGMA